MEDHRLRYGSRVAPISAGFPGYRSTAPHPVGSGLIRRFAVKPILSGLQSAYRAEERIDCAYRVELSGNFQVVAMETSVLWRTDGKGDTDIGVHFFDRRQFSDLNPFLVDQRFKLLVPLPPSPLSYQGFLIKLEWLVRIRIELDHGDPVTSDFPFKLLSQLDVEPHCRWNKIETGDAESD